MLRDEYLRRLTERAYIQIYLSGMDGARIYWPWRMLPVHEATDRYRNSCEQFIVDSAWNKPETYNADVLEQALAVDAEFAVLADVYQDKDATVNALIDGYEYYRDHTFDGHVVYPLQAPHAECYQELREHGIPVQYAAVGGLKDAQTSEQIAAAQSLRDVAGDDIWIHGLGWGLRMDGDRPNELVAALHETPSLLDSIDYSTPAQETTSPVHAIDTGEEMSSYQAAQIGTWLIRDLRRVSPYAEVDTHQQALTEWSE